MNRYGLLGDYVLALTVENFLQRRLQTIVFKNGMAKSIHHARVLIRQRHAHQRPAEGSWPLASLGRAHFLFAAP
ncbi:hypothetical protein GUJ93_ZPchr0013g34000 [Zizania palustris]|uniref:RNA-binding S4 domain-containing protein n=1 Tax=Zizania palustris TaxID=103762 RepID=A0A8J5X0Y9_ZIZPA|nr:hypothetical protein GUJ93_ZPchr0013g34000 [Zizania palustris]